MAIDIDILEAASTIRPLFAIAKSAGDRTLESAQNPDRDSHRCGRFIASMMDGGPLPRIPKGPRMSDAAWARQVAEYVKGMSLRESVDEMVYCVEILRTDGYFSAARRLLLVCCWGARAWMEKRFGDDWEAKIVREMAAASSARVKMEEEEEARDDWEAKMDSRLGGDSRLNNGG